MRAIMWDFISLSNGDRWGRNMFNYYRALRPFAGILSVFAICVSAGAQDCSDLMGVHDLLPRMDNQIASREKLAYDNGPLKPGKSGYGFALRETLFEGLKCKANPLFRDQNIVLNCAVATLSKMQAEEISNDVLGCMLENGWGQRGIYLVDAENDITLAKLYTMEDSFSIEFIQIKSFSGSSSNDAP